MHGPGHIDVDPGHERDLVALLERLRADDSLHILTITDAVEPMLSPRDRQALQPDVQAAA